MTLKLVLATIATALLATLLIWAGTVAVVSAGWGFTWSTIMLGAAVATFAGAFALPTSIMLGLFVFIGRRMHWPMGIWPLLGIGVGAGVILPRVLGLFVHALGRLTAWALPTGILVVLIFWLLVRPDRASANPNSAAP